MCCRWNLNNDLWTWVVPSKAEPSDRTQVGYTKLESLEYALLASRPLFARHRDLRIGISRKESGALSDAQHSSDCFSRGGVIEIYLEDSKRSQVRESSAAFQYSRIGISVFGMNYEGLTLPLHWEGIYRWRRVLEALKAPQASPSSYLLTAPEHKITLGDWKSN